MREQILLPGGADLLELSVFGEGGESALHGAYLLEALHLEEEIESAAFLVAV